MKAKQLGWYPRVSSFFVVSWLHRLLRMVNHCARNTADDAGEGKELCHGRIALNIYKNRKQNQTINSIMRIFA
jgi:hypothetical protein